MIRKLLDVDGPVLGCLEKCGQLIVLSALWLLCSLPVVTACASWAALYHAVTQAVRAGQGSAVKEFRKCFLANLTKGLVLSVILVGALAALEAASVYIMNSLIPTGVICILMILDVFLLIYVGPVCSRFQMGITQTLKLSFVLSLQYAHYTFVFLIGTLVLTALQFFVFPMAAVLFVPGVWCLGISFLMEKVLNRYTPGSSGTEDYL